MTLYRMTLPESMVHLSSLMMLRPRDGNTGNDNHMIGSVENGLGHGKHKALLLDLRVVLVGLLEYHEQVDDNDK